MLQAGGLSYSMPPWKGPQDIDSGEVGMRGLRALWKAGGLEQSPCWEGRGKVVPRASQGCEAMEGLCILGHGWDRGPLMALHPHY